MLKMGVGKHVRRIPVWFFTLLDDKLLELALFPATSAIFSGGIENLLWHCQTTSSPVPLWKTHQKKGLQQGMTRKVGGEGLDKVQVAAEGEVLELNSGVIIEMLNNALMGDRLVQYEGRKGKHFHSRWESNVKEINLQSSIIVNSALPLAMLLGSAMILSVWKVALNRLIKVNLHTPTQKNVFVETLKKEGSHHMTQKLPLRSLWRR